MPTSLPRGLVFLLVAPQLLLGAVSIVLVVLGCFGRNPFWSATPLTLSEATALRDHASVLALLQEGIDPRRAYPIRAGLIGEREAVLTPMEAAIHENRSEMAQVLLQHGLTADQAQLCEWLGLATAAGKDEVMTYLRQTYPTESAACGSTGAGEIR